MRAKRWTKELSQPLRALAGRAWELVITPDGPQARDGTKGGVEGFATGADWGAAAIAAKARDQAPLIWLLGKVQAGKSSLIQAITDCSAVQIGEGYKACTRSSTIFEFPQEAPLLRFLDTRGIGEAFYDPTEDLAFCAGRAQLLLVVMKALDPQQNDIVDLVRQLRRVHPDWPVVVAQSCLHEAYGPADNHPSPYPYGDSDGATVHDPVGQQRRDDLSRALAFQRQLFADLPGTGQVAFVPLDFTASDDGYDPRFFGLEALLSALASAVPEGVIGALRQQQRQQASACARQAHPHIVGYASAAAAADIMPIAGLVAVPGIQAKLLHSLARIYNVQWSQRLWLEFSAQLGSGIVLRILAGLGLRELVKLVPGYGQTIGTAGAAATSFMTTYALGRAACVFLDLGRRNDTAQEMATDAVAHAYKNGLVQALELVRNRQFDESVGQELQLETDPADAADTSKNSRDSGSSKRKKSSRGSAQGG